MDVRSPDRRRVCRHEMGLLIGDRYADWRWVYRQDMRAFRFTIELEAVCADRRWMCRQGIRAFS